jgi:hypothetical protein
VYDNHVGWRPATGAIKPVHIANGLYRDLVGHYYDLKPTVSFVIPWKKKNNPVGDPKRTYEHLVEDPGEDRFVAFKGGGQNKVRFAKFRDFLRGVLAADGAVFPDPEGSSLTLTCKQMITRDQMDKHVGRFMADIIRGRNKSGPLAKEVLAGVQKGSERPCDPITFASWPLLKSEHDDKPLKPVSRCSPFDTKKLRQFHDHLEAAAADLAGHEANQGNRLATLQRTVHFACVALLAHAQALAVDGVLQNRAPLLIAMEAPKGSPLAIASEASLNAYYASFEAWLARQLGVLLTKGAPLCPNEDSDGHEDLGELPDLRKDAVRKWLSQILLVKGANPTPAAIADRMYLYEQALAQHGKDDPGLVLGETLVQSYVAEYETGGPRKFLGGLGRKVGVIFPHFQGRSREKRIRPSIPILDMLVKACTETKGPVPLHVFQQRLWERFGMVLGTRHDEEGGDHALLVSHGIEVSKTDLDTNIETFVDHLVQLQLARRYPDNITYIGRYHA